MTKQLGELLIEQRFITQSMLDQALALQQQRHLPLGKILLQLGYVTEDDLNVVLAKQFGSIYINPRGFVLRDTSLLNLIPEETARKLACFPIEQNGEQLTLAMADPWNTEAIHDLTELTHLTVQPIFSRKEWISQIIDKYYKTIKKEIIPPEIPILQPESEKPISVLTPEVQSEQPLVQTGLPSESSVTEPTGKTLKQETQLLPEQKELIPESTKSFRTRNQEQIPGDKSIPQIKPKPQFLPNGASAAELVVPEQRLKKTTLLSQPMPELTFEYFVVGTCNQLAWAAAKNVAETTGSAYNPLFIYGGSGLGKTHLANAIGNLMLQHQPEAVIACVPCNRFIEELINAIANGKINEFHSRYWNLQLLLIDDIQFLAGQERTQVELFQTFEELHYRKAQIVLTSDRLPKDIPQLEDRLRSRFEGGLIVDVQIPDLETRAAILRRKAALHKIELSDDITNLVATFISTNVRELEGVLNKINAITQLTGHPVTLQVVQNIISELMKQSPMKPV
jgi:chromosomal replication initiator protein